MVDHFLGRCLDIGCLNGIFFHLYLGHFDGPKQVVDVFLVFYLGLVPVEEGEHELVEEDPAMLEELVEKCTHVLTGNHGGKQAEYPLASVNVRF